ncbi:hypothetical protein Kisp01_68640 [Kineosporia sp. NBRC 101677]|nr:hypothetical protein Kisp01_68640 [Kineosporia sp. NBRC 101677]
MPTTPSPGRPNHHEADDPSPIIGIRNDAIMGTLNAAEQPFAMSAVPMGEATSGPAGAGPNTSPMPPLNTWPALAAHGPGR